MRSSIAAELKIVRCIYGFVNELQSPYIFETAILATMLQDVANAIFFKMFSQQPLEIEDRAAMA